MLKRAESLARTASCHLVLPTPAVQQDQRLLTRKLLYLLGRCVSTEQMQQIHAQMLMSSIEKPNFLLPRAINLRDLAYASLIFSSMDDPDEYCFNVMIRGLTTTWQNYGAAIGMYLWMKNLDLKPDKFTYPFVFLASANLRDLKQGRSAHGSVFKAGLEEDDHVSHTLITMYSKCGELGFARQAFDEIVHKDLVSWNSMISGYSQMGYASDALNLFRRMRAEGLEADEKTLVCTLGACGDLGDLSSGKWVEEIALNKKMKMSTFLGSALISMYGKCGELVSARKIFDEISVRDRVIWNSIITAYAQNGMSEEAIKLFHMMKDTGIGLDKISLVAVLSACASIGALDLGKWVETYTAERGMQENIYVTTALVDMYAKCGSLDDAFRVFEAMPVKNEVSWNAMISALAFHGQAHEALSLFDRMLEVGMATRPDDVTFVGVLSACVHAGLVDQGRQLFDEMSSTFGLVPKVEHYSCMIDLLSRAGLLREAWDFIEKMPEKPDEIMLGALLGACQKHKNVEIGERVMKRLLGIQPQNSGNYIISSKVYAHMRMWDESAKMRMLMRERGVAKTPGCSWIEIGGQLHEFHAGHELHGDLGAIGCIMDSLLEEMRREGYVPQVDCN